MFYIFLLSINKSKCPIRNFCMKNPQNVFNSQEITQSAGIMGLHIYMKKPLILVVLLIEGIAKTDGSYYVQAEFHSMQVHSLIWKNLFSCIG